MKRKYTFLCIVLWVALVSSGCQGAQRLLHEQVDASPAPTAVPLPSATPSPTDRPTLPTATFTPQSPTFTPIPQPNTPMPTHTRQPSSPTPVPPADTPTSTHAVTRVVPPAEPIRLPPGFGISVYAQGLRGPRMLALGPDGRIHVAERGAGRIVRLPDRDQDGVADGIETVAENLSEPSSLAFYRDGSLYVGETTRVLRLSEPDVDGLLQEREIIVEGLPRGGHSTRTLLFSPDWTWLYVSVGSSCNVCVEDDERRAAIVRYAPDGSAETVYARGLRNAVGITFRPGSDELWATNNGRDWLGDDQPPETIHVVRQGDDAGWPRCHAGRIIDPDFGSPDACASVVPPAVEMQAHSAPLGLTFYDGQQFPHAYHGDLFVAFHGSWNRSTPTGYKVVRISMQDGVPGPVSDFAVDWLREDGSQWGRPVDVLTGPDGSLYISDDGQGRVYRVFYTKE